MVDLYKEHPKEKNISQNKSNSIFLEATLEPQSNLHKKDSLSILKDDFFSRADPPIFTSIAIELSDQSNETSLSFSSIEINKPLEVNPSSCQKSNVWCHLECIYLFIHLFIYLFICFSFFKADTFSSITLLIKIDLKLQNFIIL